VLPFGHTSHTPELSYHVFGLDQWTSKLTEFSFRSSDWVEDPIKLFQGCSSPSWTSMLNTVTSVAVRAHTTHTRVVLPCLRTGSMDVQTHRVFLPVFGLGQGSHKTLSDSRSSVYDIVPSQFSPHQRSFHTPPNHVRSRWPRSMTIYSILAVDYIPA
jgi:hypothetical protein